MKIFLELSFLTTLVWASPIENFDWSKVKIFEDPLKLPLHFNHTDADSIANPIVQRIVGGSIAEPNSFPYQAGLLIAMEGGYSWCGGSIISNDFILSAAHCVDPAQQIIVFLGAHNIRNNIEDGQVRIVVEQENFILHPEWDAMTVSNDIALIQLPYAIEFNDKIQPVHLPNFSKSTMSFEGYFATASGWGKFSDENPNQSDVLRYVELPIVSPNQCIKYFQVFKSSNICTSGANGRSACQGDSGGPLVIEENGKSIIVGLTSFGYKYGCELNWPAVFTRVSSYVPWIVDNINAQY